MARRAGGEACDARACFSEGTSFVTITNGWNQVPPAALRHFGAQDLDRPGRFVEEIRRGPDDESAGVPLPCPQDPIVYLGGEGGRLRP